MTLSILSNSWLSNVSSDILHYLLLNMSTATLNTIWAEALDGSAILFLTNASCSALSFFSEAREVLFTSNVEQSFVVAAVACYSRDLVDPSDTSDTRDNGTR